jgi:inorganic pyrophosphatase
VAALTPVTKKGDGDPLDICVLSERPINKSEIILSARVIGGLQLVDRDEADDKFIAVLQGDYVWGDAHELSDVPSVLVERLEHYFSTYKLVPGEPTRIRVAGSYDTAHAHAVVQAAMEDYDESFGARA